MRTMTHESVGELLAEHEGDRREQLAKGDLVDSIVCLLEACLDDVPAYRHRLSEARTEHRKAQRANRTSLVLESATFDASSPDDLAELTSANVCDLHAVGVTIPAEACVVRDPIPHDPTLPTVMTFIDGPDGRMCELSNVVEVYRPITF